MNRKKPQKKSLQKAPLYTLVKKLHAEKDESTFMTSLTLEPIQPSDYEHNNKFLANPLTALREPLELPTFTY